jgi:hypothetical protein
MTGVSNEVGRSAIDLMAVVPELMILVDDPGEADLE